MHFLVKSPLEVQLRVRGIRSQRSSNISSTTPSKVAFSAKDKAMRRTAKLEKGLKCMPFKEFRRISKVFEAFLKVKSHGLAKEQPTRQTLPLRSDRVCA